MKITLIFPPSLYQTKQTMPPLGIAWIAAVLRENGYTDVSLIDSVINKYSNDDVINILKKNPPDIVGVSFGTQNRFYAFDLIRLIRKNFPGVLITVGGPHPTLTAPDILQNIPEIDIVIRGEGEYTMLDLVKTVDKKGNLSQVKGISFREKNGQVINNFPRQPIADLDSLPMPARDLLPIDKYQQTIPLSDKICTSMISARGCPYNCVYCSTAQQWGHSIRHRSADNVIKEIKHLMSTYKLDGVGFFDDVFTMDKNRVIEFCQKLIASKFNISWWCEARANTIDKEVVDWMKRAGCEHISMAIESGSEKILKNIRKAITVEQGVEAAKIIKQSGIKLKVFFMHSLPEETYEDIKKTVFLSHYLVNKIKVDEATQSLTLIYPGTALERLAKENGTLPKDFSWSKFYEEKRVYPPLDRCENMPVFEQPNLSYEQVFKYVKKAKAVYYLSHPCQFIKNVVKYRKTILKWITTRV